MMRVAEGGAPGLEDVVFVVGVWAAGWPRGNSVGSVARGPAVLEDSLAVEMQGPGAPECLIYGGSLSSSTTHGRHSEGTLVKRNCHAVAIE